MGGIKMKNISILVLLFVCIFAMSSVANALPVQIGPVKFDGNVIEPYNDQEQVNYIRGLKRGDTFDVSVEIMNNGPDELENVQIDVMLRGYDHDDRIEDTSDVFDMAPGVSFIEKFTLRFPDRIDTQGYRLRIIVSNRNSQLMYSEYSLDIQAERHGMKIQDVFFSPAGEVMAGRSLLTSVRVKNVGEGTEEGIKIIVSVPGLGISATDYIDEVDEDDSTTSEELYMRVPQCARAGTYDVDVRVEFDEGDEVVSTTDEVTVTADSSCGAAGAEATGVTTITVPQANDVTIGGSEAVYPVMITNNKGNDMVYTLSLVGVDSWGTERIDPSNVVIVGAGKTGTAYVYVAANDNAATGIHSFALNLVSTEGTDTVSLQANVLGGSSQETGTGIVKLKKALEIGLIVLVVLLVVLGLIIGFNKLTRGREPESEDAGQTYY